MKLELRHDHNYMKWLSDIKTKVQQAQLKAAVKVNTELLMLYWELGTDIVAKQVEAKWGDGFLLQLSKDLTSEFPDMKGFSERNLKYIRQWYLFYTRMSDKTVIAIGQQAVAQLVQIPWVHYFIVLNYQLAKLGSQDVICIQWKRVKLLALDTRSLSNYKRRRSHS